MSPLLFVDLFVSYNGGLREWRDRGEDPQKKGVSEVCCCDWSVARHPRLLLACFSGPIADLLSFIVLRQKMWLIRWTSRTGWKDCVAEVQETPSPVRKSTFDDFGKLRVCEKQPV